MGLGHVDEWLRFYNQECPHLGRYRYGKTPRQTFREAKHLADDKMLNRQMPLCVNIWVQASERQEVGMTAVG